jgi:alkanesulfonate monooxygenase SsuD/methylene tetrahydromethanopterin reductase-like flavin-dependent oxidoreductase (luciferase family)
VITTYCTDDDVRKLRELCDAAFDKHGRPRPGFPLCVYTTVRIEKDAAKAEEVTADFLKKYYGGGVNFRGLMGLGTPAAVIDTLKRYEAAGVTDLCIRFAGTDQLDQLEKFARDVLPAFA